MRFFNVENNLDYYSFGMLMPERFGGGDYRYGFGSQERDDEVSGKGNSYTATYWQYDSRLGRRWNVDPVVKYHESTFTTFANNPIWFVDPSGADTTRNSENHLVWKVEKGDTYYSIGKKIQEYGLESTNIYKKIENYNKTQEADKLQIGSILNIAPTFVISDKYPTLFAARTMWLSTHPEHFTLTYIGPQSVLLYKKIVDKNRRIATAPIKHLTKYIPFVDADEFPYASTYEGGEGAGAWPIPSWENQGEGRDLGSFYRTSGIQPGQKFNISLGGGTPQNVPIPTPIPIPKPVITPPSYVPFLVPRISIPRATPAPSVTLPFLDIPSVLEMIIFGSNIEYNQREQEMY